MDRGLGAAMGGGRSVEPKQIPRLLMGMVCPRPALMGAQHGGHPLIAACLPGWKVHLALGERELAALPPLNPCSGLTASEEICGELGGTDWERGIFGFAG